MASQGSYWQECKKFKNILQVPGGEEEVQDYTVKLHVTKEHVAKVEYRSREITDGLGTYIPGLINIWGSE